MSRISNELNTALLDFCPTALITLNARGEITYANNRAEKIFGIPKDEITQRTYNDPRWKSSELDGTTLSDEKFPFRKCILKEEPVDNIRHAIEKQDGTRVIISVDAMPFKGRDGQIENVMVALRDITDIVNTEVKIKEASNTYKKLFENLIDEVHLWKVMKDNQGRIEGWALVDANPTALRAWGKSREEVLGKNAVDIFNADVREQFLPLIKKIFDTGEPHTWEDYFAPTNQYLSMTSIPLGESFISTGRDITKQKQDEKKILEAKEKAEEANRLKTEFLKNMSHEIRTPMNGIIGFSDLLNHPDLKKEEIEQYTAIIRNSSLQLLRTIDDILEISTLESQKNVVVESAFSLNELLIELHSVFSLKSNSPTIPIHLTKPLGDEESTIVSDRSKLYKIMRNLMENALKFTHEGSVELGYQIEEDLLILFVKDTGIGISPENSQTIFDRFSQEDSELSKKNYGGLGLGLSISRESAKLLGGDITMESEKGKGSVFWVTMPLKRPGKEEEKENESHREVLVKKDDYTVLVAENEDVNFFILEILIKKRPDRKYGVVRAFSGEEAVKICRDRNDIDLILMDIRMPKMDGLRAAQIIKSEYSDIPIIAQTAYSTEADRQLAIQNGCDEFITKPLSQQKLYELLDRHLTVD